jgi:hypothetical protein
MRAESMHEEDGLVCHGRNASASSKRACICTLATGSHAARMIGNIWAATRPARFRKKSRQPLCLIAKLM